MRLALAAVLAATPALADPAQIVSAEARRAGAAWTFDVTLRHGDTGWDDYADGWRIDTEAGEVLGTRTLLHPHVEEQPFTRALAGVAVPDGVAAVWIRARTSVTGWDAARVRVPLH